jgi:hypothetical protein
MNRHENGFASSQEAKLQYGPGDFHVVTPGGHVRCAVTGEKIALEDLKYWSAQFQEAYASPEAVLARLQQRGLTHL